MRDLSRQAVRPGPVHDAPKRLDGGVGEPLTPAGGARKEEAAFIPEGVGRRRVASLVIRFWRLVRCAVRRGTAPLPAPNLQGENLGNFDAGQQEKRYCNKMRDLL